MKIQIIICDEKQEDLMLLEEHIHYYAIQKKLDLSVLTYSYSDLLLNDLTQERISPDILFLDIHMFTTSGRNLAGQLRANGYEGAIVLMTVSSDYLLDAFDAGACNCLVKNQTSKERFDQVLGRCIEKVQEDAKEWLVLSRSGESRKIPIQSIQYFEIIKRVVTVYFRDQTFEYYSTMEKLEQMMQYRGFIRIHRAFLVSVWHIEAFRRNEVILLDGKRLPIGRTYYRKAREQFFRHLLKPGQQQNRIDTEGPVMAGGADSA